MEGLRFEAGESRQCASFTYPDNDVYESSPVLVFMVALSTSQSRVTAADTVQVRVDDDDSESNDIIHQQIITTFTWYGRSSDCSPTNQLLT